jgi:crossover junction endodeoxyribonuclease RuvC
MIILGIDPGLSGAVATLDTIGCWVTVADIPVFEVRRGGKKRHDIDGRGLCRLIAAAKPGHAYVEQAQAMPKQSAYATGIFFQVYGEVRGILTGLGVPFTIVHPKTWKLALHVPAEKDGARARASQLLPQAAHCWPLKKHDGRSEAALIAWYGALQLANIGKDAMPTATAEPPLPLFP